MINDILTYLVWPWAAAGGFVGLMYLIAWNAAPRRPRIDWDHVYAMERAIWGETFEHAEAPKPPNPLIIPLKPKSIGYRNIETTYAEYERQERQRVRNAEFDRLHQRIRALDQRIGQTLGTAEFRTSLRAQRAQAFREIEALMLSGPYNIETHANIERAKAYLEATRD